MITSANKSSFLYFKNVLFIFVYSNSDNNITSEYQ